MRSQTLMAIERAHHLAEPVQRRQGEKRAAHETLEQALAIFDQVARALCLSAKTVAWNLSKVYRKLGVRSRTELAARWQPSNRR